MLHGILKQNQVHVRMQLIVALKCFCQDASEFVPVLNRHVVVLPWSLAEVAVDKGLSQHNVVL